MSTACGSIEDTVYLQLSKKFAALRQSADVDRDVDRFRVEYFMSSLLRKHQSGGSASARKKATTAAWFAAEKACFVTNLRLATSSWTSSTLIRKVQRLILDVIGSEPDHDSIASLCRWGPGATFDVSRRDAHVAFKTTSRLSCTRGALKHLTSSPYMDEYLADAMGTNGFRVVRGNRSVQVAKTSSINRTIAAEPTGNAFIQSGVGRFMRKRLKMFGVDLDDQTINQLLARFARDFGLCTIDLEAASDSLCRLLVDLLLPPKWTAFLNEIRSPFTKIEGRWVRLEKFSSMGNGFTFELETLLFWALCKVASNGSPCVWVYGDDIVVEKKHHREVMDCLRFAGFTVNKDKTFVDGDFYESCGKHFYRNFDVTPVFQKKPVDSLSERIRFHNRLFRWAERYGLLSYVAKSLSFIRGHDAKLGRRLPLQEVGTEGDSGYLDSAFRPIPNRRYPVLTPVHSMRALSNVEELGALSYKMRQPLLYSSPCPRGHQRRIRRTEYLIRHKVLALS